jgi:phosphohistidine phosphatase
MKQLLIIRHAKSSWDYDVSDIDRSLTERGVADVYKIGEAFSKQGVHLDWIYSSSATRALQTALIFSRATHHPVDNISISDSLYDFSGESFTQFIRGMDNRYQRVGIFGHNHAVTHVVSWLLEKALPEIPTAGLHLIESEVDSWEEFISGKLTVQLYPKLI